MIAGAAPGVREPRAGSCSLPYITVKYISIYYHNRIIVIGGFDSHGFLVPGIHDATWEELLEKFGFNEHRTRMLGGLERAMYNLRKAGCRRVYVDGSFVTRKEFPNDYDAVWDNACVDTRRIDGVFKRFDDGCRSQKLKYGGEFYPESATEAGSNKRFLEYFQAGEYGPKGIVLIEMMKL